MSNDYMKDAYRTIRQLKIELGPLLANPRDEQGRKTEGLLSFISTNNKLGLFMGHINEYRKQHHLPIMPLLKIRTNMEASFQELETEYIDIQKEFEKIQNMSVVKKYWKQE